MIIDQYFNQRIQALGLTPTEAQNIHGLSYDKKGNIIQAVKHFDGSPLMFLPQFGKIRKAYDKHQRTLQRKSTFMPLVDESRFWEAYTIVRYHPKYVERYPSNGKYRYPSKKYTHLSPCSIPNHQAIQRFNQQQTGGTLFLTEGVFKAISLAVQGVEAVAYGGISMFKIDKGLKEYLRVCRPQNVVLLYDADAYNIKIKGKDINEHRPNNFLSSANNFTSAFFQFCEEEAWNNKEEQGSHHCQLHWCMINPQQTAKGIDDLIYEEGAKQVIPSLQSLASSDYFRFITLPKGSYQSKLKKALGLDSPDNFYQIHQHEIGQLPFSFKSIHYQYTTIHTPAYSLFDGKAHAFAYLKVIQDPHEIELAQTPITVGKYLDEEQETIDNIIAQKDRLLFDAPTGCGKTSFFMGYPNGKKWQNGYFQRTKTKGVIVVPYRASAMQLARKGVGLLCGQMSRAAKIKALQHDIVICTYDHLKNVLDLSSRIMVIDEAHNLVSQEEFRSDTLSHIIDRVGETPKTIFISGTPPKALCKKLDFHYVQVNRQQNNTIRLFHLEGKDLTATLIAQLRAENWDDNGIRLALFNNTAKAEMIKSHLVEAGFLQAAEIDIISRKHINEGKSNSYQGIVEQEMVKGVKLVLCTCLLSEAININNTNIAKVFAVQLDDIDMLRQWAARFRKMEMLEVYSIRKPSYNTAYDFHKPTSIEIDDVLSITQLQAQLLQRDYHKFIKTNQIDDPEYCQEIIDSILKGNQYKAHIYDLCRIDGTTVKPDLLKILHEEKKRLMKGMNNHYYYSMLASFPNIQLVGYGQAIDDNKDSTKTDIHDDIYKDLKARKKEGKAVEQQLESAFLVDLKEKPTIVISALKEHYKNTRNNKHNGLIQTYWEEREEPCSFETAHYYQQQQTYFNHKQLRTKAIQYMKLSLVLSHEVAIDKVSQQDIATTHQDIRQVKHLIAEKVLDSKRKRTTLSKLAPIHARELKSKSKLKQLIQEQFQNGKATIQTLLQLFRNAGSRLIPHPDSHRGSIGQWLRQPFVKWTPTKMLNILREMFHINVSKDGQVQFTDIGTWEMFHCGEEPPQVSYDKMLKILVL